MWENLAFTVVGILVGGFIGHRLALGRDKRREFNELARPVYVDLLGALRNVEQGSANIRINFRAIEEVKTSLPYRKKVALSEVIGDYQKLMSRGWKDVGAGAQEFKKELCPELGRILRRLANLLEPR